MPETIPSSSQLVDYWDSIASLKKFRHPLPQSVVDKYFPDGARVLDIGCGYGRLVENLLAQGFSVAGTDTSTAMLKEARKNAPKAELQECRSDLPWDDKTYDVVLLVTLLTSVPFDLEQRQIMSEVRRVLKPGGYVFVSDLPLQWSAQYLERYRDGQKRYGQYGVFDLAGGGTVRHHEQGYFMQLMNGFKCLEMETHEVETMNGNQAQAVRFVGQLPA